MPSSVVQICNMALSRIGVARVIADIAEDSQEANTCSLFYEQVRDDVLRDAAWSFATRYATLALVEEEPNDDWQYAYRAPSDLIRPIRVVTDVRREVPRTPFKRGSDASGGLIYTDQQDAVLEYTARIEDTTQFPSDFVNALAWKLALEIGMPLAQDPRFADRAAQYYAAAMRMATTNAANEEAPDTPPEAEQITARA